MRVIDADVLFSILDDRMKEAEEDARHARRDVVAERADAVLSTLECIKAGIEDEVITAEPTRRARWINETAIHRRTGKEARARFCTACGAGYVNYRGILPDIEDVAPNFCPNCGAEMEDEE